jgi:hypothetical protein
MMALLVAIVGVQPLFAQDLGFTSVNKNLPGLGNRGVTGATASGFLNTTLMTGAGVQPNFLSQFNVVDVAVGDFNGDGVSDIAAVSGDTNIGGSDSGTLVLFFGLNDGTFGLPQAFFLSDVPTSIATADIDLDGLPDLAIGELSGVDVVSGSFLATGFTTVDTFLPTPNIVVSVAIGRLNTDAIADIAVAFQNASGPAAGLVFFSDINTGTFLGATTTITTQGIVDSDFLPAPRAISINQSNLFDASLTPPAIDGDLDIFIATNFQGGSVEVLENTGATALTNPTFDVPGNVIINNVLTPAVVNAGTNTIGVITLDVNADTLIDVVALNRGSGTVTTNVAVNTQNGGYNPPLQSLAGRNPVSLAAMNFNNDGKVDVVVANQSLATFGTGSVNVLTGNGTGAFQTARTFSFPNFAIINPQSVAVGRFDRSSQTDDIVEADGEFPGFSVGGVTYIDAGAGYNLVFLQIFSAVSLTTDFDGQGGINDVAVVEQNFGFVFVLLNLTTTGAPQVGVLAVADLFTQFTVLPTSATSFKDALTGLNDLAITDIGTPTGNTGFGQIIVGLNDGTGNFLDIFQFRQFVATPGATNVLSNDFNNDGIDDLVYVDFGSNFAAVALNDGTNFFLTPQFRETGGFVPVSAALADVNDDDDMDVVVVNQGSIAGGTQFNQSLVSVLLGQGDGRLVPTGSLLQVPNFALSIVGGLADTEATSTRRIVDFNNDGFPDFAVASTRGGLASILVFNPTVTLLLNRPDAPGNFTVQQPIQLIDDTAGNQILQLEADLGGPGVVSGRFGDPTVIAPLVGLFGTTAAGGANYVMAVGDFNADGSPDLVVTGTSFLDGFNNFRASVYLIGNETAGTMRISRPLRSVEYGGPVAAIAGGDTFVACATGNFAPLANNVPDVFHISINGNLWIDANTTSVLNHAPILDIRRADLNAPFPGGGRKEIITAGESVDIPVTGFDPDNDKLSFRLAPLPTGEQPPSFVTVKDNGNNTATIMVESGDVNRGPGDAIFRIAVEATDVATSGPGGRLPLIGREYFTLVVHPNTPPTIGAIPNQTIEAGMSQTINLSVTDKEGQTVTNTVACDKGSFVTVSGTTLSINPGPGDVGTTTCTVTATDQFGLSSSQTFAITVTPANEPPTIASISAQTVQAGGAPVNVPVSATDPNGNVGLRLSINSSLPFVSLTDNGNGTGTIRIAPSLSDTASGAVTVTVTDPGGLTANTTFNVTVNKAVQIVAASYAKPNLFISGVGFGSSGAKVSVNGQDVSARIIGQTDQSITVKGNKKKLNLKTGPNNITVTSNGITSNTFVLNLLNSEE